MSIGVAFGAVFPRKSISRNFAICFAAILIAFETLIAFPYYFCYTNPLFGGSYRSPPALHDSNFDGGQDLWVLQKWLIKNPPKEGSARFICADSAVPLSAYGFVPETPPVAIVRNLLASREPNSWDDEKWSGGQNVPDLNTELIIMRGLQAPAPWTRINGASYELHELLIATAKICPDEFITPTLAIYRFRNGSLCFDKRHRG